MGLERLGPTGGWDRIYPLSLDVWMVHSGASIRIWGSDGARRVGYIKRLFIVLKSALLGYLCPLSISMIFGGND